MLLYHSTLRVTHKTYNSSFYTSPHKMHTNSEALVTRRLNTEYICNPYNFLLEEANEYASICEFLRLYFSISVVYGIASETSNKPCACFKNKTAVEIAMSRECRLTSIKEEFYAMKYAICFPNQSPHTRIFPEQ